MDQKEAVVRTNRFLRATLTDLHRLSHCVESVRDMERRIRSGNVLYNFGRFTLSLPLCGKCKGYGEKDKTICNRVGSIRAMELNILSKHFSCSICILRAQSLRKIDLDLI